MKKGIQCLIWVLCAQAALAQTNLIDSLQHIVAQQRHDSTELKALLNLANELSRKDIEMAKHFVFQIIPLARNLKKDQSLCQGYLYLITFHQNSGRLDSASYYLTLMEAIMNANPGNSKIKINYNQSASLFYKNQGQFLKALPFMKDNLLLLTEENESRAGQLLNIGNTYSSVGDYKQAISYHLQGLSLFEKLKSRRGQSFCLQSLGNDLMELSQFEKAKEYFLQSLKLKEELQDKRGIISTSIGLGNAYTQLNQVEQAKRYYSEALQSSREMKLMLDEARSLNQLGLLHLKIGNSQLAKETLSASLKLAKQAGDSTMTAKINGGLIQLSIQEKKEQVTEEALFKNLNAIINSGDRSGEATEYLRLSEYYVSKKQFDKAYYYLRQHETLKDSVEGSAVLLQIKQLEGQYQNEKKEIEIGLLKKDQELQALALSKQQIVITFIVIALISVIVIGLLLINRYRVMNKTKRLIEIEKMRNSIARDLHDDIGSTLSSINILSQVALVEQNGNTQNYLQRIGEQSTRIMEEMSDMVWSINPSNDSMQRVISRMREFASEIFEAAGIDYRFSEKIKDNLTLNSDKRKNLFLVFKEAVNNAAKYSKATTVEIDLYQQDHTLILKVKDNGLGFDEQNIVVGNGLHNQRERAKEISGQITLTSKNGLGTEVVLQLPIA